MNTMDRIDDGRMPRVAPSVEGWRDVWDRREGLACRCLVVVYVVLVLLAM